MTTVRNDNFFLPKWITYHGAEFGFKNLYVILDGHDQDLPTCPGAEDVNFIRLPFVPLKRAAADRRRARIMSAFAQGLFWLYDTVMAMDVDEFLVVDPETNLSLSEYLHKQSHKPTLSALGLDVGQHLELEEKIDPSRPFLSQRNYAHLSSRYTKPVVTNKPLTWGSGMHRIKGRNYHIDPNLYLFHFGMIDLAKSVGNKSATHLIDSGWSGHLSRRNELFQIITDAKSKEWNKIIPKARSHQQWHRQLLAWNKPALLKDKPVVKIPDRFRRLI